jgi:hypothetical protein
MVVVRTPWTAWRSDGAGSAVCAVCVLCLGNGEDSETAEGRISKTDEGERWHFNGR